jgi:hypothetical protein
MIKHASTQRFFNEIGLVLLITAVGYQVIRQIHLNLGVTLLEIQRSILGDITRQRWTSVISINTTPKEIYSRLVQFGLSRVSLYIFDWLENPLGFDLPSANQILPEYQHLPLGHDICMVKDRSISQVSILDPGRYFGWQSPEPDGRLMWNFILGLYSVDEQHTRLVVRETLDPAVFPAIDLLILEIQDVVMEQKLLDTLKQRVEGQPVSFMVTLMEISVWVLTLLSGLAASIQVLRRQERVLPLEVDLAAVLDLLVTSLYPALWLRIWMSWSPALLAGDLFISPTGLGGSIL